MNLMRFRAVARMETLHLLRDPRSLLLALAVPALLLVLFGWALALDVEDVALAVWDQSRTPASRDYLSRFEGSRTFRIAASVPNYDALERAIDEGEALAALVIPADFAKRSNTGGTVSVQMIVDGSDANTATIALGYAQAVTEAYSRDLALERMRRLGGATVRLPLQAKPRVWFNEDLESKNTIIPGLIALIMMIIAALLTSTALSREREGGTMEQLASTPVKGAELILGKLVPYFAVGMIDVLISVVMAAFLFDVPFRGSLVWLFGIASVFLLGALCMGLLISSLARTQILSIQIAMVATFIPAFLLSGLVFPIENMPAVVRAITHLVPARYFVTILKDLYMKGAGPAVFHREALFLAAFSAAMLLLSVIRFKKKV